MQTPQMFRVADLREAKLANEDAKEQASAARAEYEACRVRHESISSEIRDVRFGRLAPAPRLIGDDGEATPEARAEEPAVDAADAAEPDPAAGDTPTAPPDAPPPPIDAAKLAQPISVLGLAPGLGTILDAANILTVGDLHRRMQAGEWWNKDIKGLGGQRAGVVADAVNAYLFDWK